MASELTFDRCNVHIGSHRIQICENIHEVPFEFLIFILYPANPIWRSSSADIFLFSPVQWSVPNPLKSSNRFCSAQAVKTSLA